MTRLIPSLALLLAVGIFFGYINPTWTGSVATAKVALASDDQLITAANQYASQQNTLAAARDGIDPADLDALATFLPDSVNNVGLILDMNALASRSGISIANADVITNASGGAPTDGSVATPTGSVDLSLAAVGSFPAFQTFLAGIERSARLLDVQDLTVQGSDTGVYHYQMRIRLYWLR